MTNHTSVRLPRVVGLLLIGLCAAPASTLAESGGSGGGQNTSGEPYPHMPSTAPIGVRTGKYLDVPDAAKGPAIPAGKAFRLQKLGTGLYMVTDNVYQSMFLVYDRGVVVVDAPPPYASHIPHAIAEVTTKWATRLAAFDVYIWDQCYATEQSLRIE